MRLSIYTTEDIRRALDGLVLAEQARPVGPDSFGHRAAEKHGFMRALMCVAASFGVQVETAGDVIRFVEESKDG